MSKVVDPKIFDEPRRAPRKSKYPYDLWTNGQAHQLTRGIDWSEKVTVQTFQCVLLTGFRVRGVQVRTRVMDENTIVIQAI